MRISQGEWKRVHYGTATELGKEEEASERGDAAQRVAIGMDDCIVLQSDLTIQVQPSSFRGMRDHDMRSKHNENSGDAHQSAKTSSTEMFTIVS